MMQKFSIPALLCVLYLTACGPGDMALSENEERKIAESVNQSFAGLVAAARSLDVDLYLEYFDDEKFTGLNADGTVIRSLDEFASDYRQGISSVESYQSLEFSNVKITVVDRATAILVNEFTVSFRLKSGDIASASGGGTQVWSKATGSWKLVSVSSSAQP